MHIVCCDFETFANRIKSSNRKIAMFGAGVIGSVAVPEIFNEYDIWQNVECFIDNDSSKWDSFIEVLDRKVEIKPPRYLHNCSGDTIISLNISRYADVLEQLESIPNTENMECYLMPMMFIHNFCQKKSEGEAKMNADLQIPKKIHYMWLGGKPLSESLKICINSWKRYCPDYEIIEWNEKNYDLTKHPYMEQAYNAEAYGFVPDYARLDILYNEGGIYMDTDVELKRNLDDMLYQEAFCGVEKWQVLNFGGCSGAIKGSMMIKRFLDARKNVYFIDEHGRQNRNTCGFYDTKTAIEVGYKLNGTTQCINNMNIYAYDFFHPYDYMSGTTNVTDNTYSIHHFNGGWLDVKQVEQNKISMSRYEKIYKESFG